MNPKTYTPAERAANLPKTNSRVPVIVPLDLLPYYYDIHGIRPNGYNEQSSILLVRKINNGPTFHTTIYQGISTDKPTR